MTSKTPLIADNEIPSADPENLLQCYDRFVYRMANRYRALSERINSVSMEDLEQAARIGLLLAQKTYEPAAGMKFISWAAFFMGKEIKQAIGIKGHRKKILSQIPLSLDAPLSIEDPKGETLLDTIPDDTETMDDRIDRETRDEALHEAIDRLCKSQKEIIELNYFQEKGLSEIAEITGTEERVIAATKRTAINQLRKDTKLFLRILDRTDFYNIRIGANVYNRTHTSSTELGAFLRIAQYEKLSAKIDQLLQSYEV